MGVDQLQRERGITGDLLEIGTYKGKSAILLGYLRRDPERLIVCDVFEDQGDLGQETRYEAASWYTGLRREEFEGLFLRFHPRLPTIWQMASASIDRVALAKAAASSTSTAAMPTRRCALTSPQPGSCWALGGRRLDDWSTAHSPGVGLAIWEEFLGGEFEILCLSPLKAYVTWDKSGLRREELERWVASQPDLEMSHAHRLAGKDVRSVSVALPAAPNPTPPEVQEPGTRTVQDPLFRRLIHDLAPPILLTGYRRADRPTGTAGELASRVALLRVDVRVVGLGEERGRGRAIGQDPSAKAPAGEAEAAGGTGASGLEVATVPAPDLRAERPFIEGDVRPEMLAPGSRIRGNGVGRDGATERGAAPDGRRPSRARSRGCWSR